MDTGRVTRSVAFRWFALVVWLSTIPLAVAVAQSQTAPAATNPTASWGDREIEEFLLKARVVRTKSAGKGVTDSTRATLTDGTVTHEAHIQTVDERKTTGPASSGAELNFRDSWAYNIAAYRLDRMIGLNLIPVSVKRDHRSKQAAYTWWVDEVMMEEGDRLKKNLQPPNPLRWNETMQLVRLFDQLIYNVDRNMGNLLITNQWRVWAIDHTRAFRLHKTLKNAASISRCDREVFERLKQLDKESVKAQLGDYLNEWERDALLARRDAIVAILEKSGDLFTRQER